MQDVPIVGYDADIYPYKLFKPNDYTAKRVIFSNADYVKQDKPHKGFNRNLLDSVLQRLRIPSAEAERHCQVYWGCTAKDLFEKDDKIGTYFNQSEQVFFNSLETDDVEAFFASMAPRISEPAEAAEAAFSTTDASAASANA